MQLGPCLRAARIRRGLTLAELAAAGGLSKGFVSQIENDKTSPSLDTLERLAAALDLSVVDLLRDATEPPLHPTSSGRPSRRCRRPPTPGPAPCRRAGASCPTPRYRRSRRVSAESVPPGSLLRSFVVDLPPGATLNALPGHHHQGEESLVVLAGTPIAARPGRRCHWRRATR